MKALCESSSQARRHFTRFDQVEQLVRASEADPDLGFMGRLMTLCSLPHANPGNRFQYKRVNGSYTLYMIAGGGDKLPFGSLSRLLLAWVSTEAVRTRSRELFLGSSLSEFMRKLDVVPVGGGSRGERTRLRNQIRRLFNAHIQLAYEDEQVSASVNSPVASRTEFWWNKRKPAAPVLWESKIELGEKFFQEIIHQPVPIDMNILKAMKRSSLGIDLYLWLTPHLHAEAPDAALLGMPLPAIRDKPGPGGRPANRGLLPHGLFARVEEDQARLAGVELRGGSGGAGPLAFKARDCAASVSLNSWSSPSRPKKCAPWWLQEA